MLRDVPPERDTLPKADTQPKLILFVPWELFCGLFIGGCLICAVFHTLWWGFALVIPIWAGAAVLVQRDMNGTRVFSVKVKLITLYLDAHRWDGALSVSPDSSRNVRHAV